MLASVGNLIMFFIGVYLVVDHCHYSPFNGGLGGIHGLLWWVVFIGIVVDDFVVIDLFLIF